MIDAVRIDLCNLIKFIDRQEQRIVYTDFADQMSDVQEVDVPAH